MYRYDEYFDYFCVPPGENPYFLTKIEKGSASFSLISSNSTAELT